jgi:hypothetical protein
MKNLKGTAITIYLVILLLVAVGWIMNVIKLANCDFESPYKCEVVHTVGLVPIVGAVTGWLDVGK